jgi:hypothetical protein
MTSCPHCEAPLDAPTPAICPSCGQTLGEPPRRAPGAAAGADETTLFEGRPASIASAGELLLVIVTLGIAWLVLWARSLSRHYKITTSRIVVEHGLFGKRIEQIDLYRVEDYVVELPLGQRMMGTGNLVLSTTDRTQKGEIRLDRLRTDVRALYEQLRNATEADKTRRGVRRFDPV